MFNWIKNLFGGKSTQEYTATNSVINNETPSYTSEYPTQTNLQAPYVNIEEFTQNVALADPTPTVTADTVTEVTTSVVTAVEPAPAEEVIAPAETESAGKKPAKKEKKTPAKPKKTASVAAETPVKKTRSSKPATINTAVVKNKKK